MAPGAGIAKPTPLSPVVNEAVSPAERLNLKISDIAAPNSATSTPTGSPNEREPRLVAPDEERVTLIGASKSVATGVPAVVPVHSDAAAIVLI